MVYGGTPSGTPDCKLYGITYSRLILSKYFLYSTSKCRRPGTNTCWMASKNRAGPRRTPYCVPCSDDSVFFWWWTSERVESNRSSPTRKEPGWVPAHAAKQHSGQRFYSAFQMKFHNEITWSFTPETFSQKVEISKCRCIGKWTLNYQQWVQEKWPFWEVGPIDLNFPQPCLQSLFA